MPIVSGGGGGGTVSPPVTITGTDAGSSPLTVVGAAAQATEAFRVRARSGDAQAALAVSKDGAVEIRNARGTDLFQLTNSANDSVFSVDARGFVIVNPDDPSSTGFQVNYSTNAQTVPLATFSGIGGGVVAVSATGYLVIQTHAAPADAELAAGDCQLWFDQTNGAAKLMVKAKQANGTVVAASIALA